MIQNNAIESFETLELVIYAKALMRNNSFLLMLDQSFADGRHNVEYKQRSVSDIRKLHEEFNRGCFLEMRRLTPKATDEAIENRIARLSRRLDRELFTQSSGSCIQYDFVELLPKLLHSLAETFLCEGNDGSIRVRSSLLDLWQDLILVVPPLLISCAWITFRLLVDGELAHTQDRQREDIHRLARWLCDSTLPVDDSPFLDYICRTHGLDEVHMHLNGTTEAEKVWCDALKHPNKVIDQLLKAKRRNSGLRVSIGSGIDRLLLQEDIKLTPQLLRHRADIAVLLKGFLLTSSQNGETLKSYITFALKDSLAPAFYRKACDAALGSGGRHSQSKVVREAWQLCQIYSLFFRKRASQDEGLALWHYALLRSQFCRLLVQQKEQVGFDQFQYITQNELREYTEKDYSERFRQLERGQQRGIDHVEGRFAPKSTPEKTASLLAQILRGYLQFLSENEFGDAHFKNPELSSYSLSELVKRIRALEEGSVAEYGASSKSIVIQQPSLRRLRFSLVAHFIKKQDASERHQFFSDGPRSVCRDSRMRRETNQAARALVKVLRDTQGLSHFVRGIDAASNERHATPEIFAPTFRLLRAAGVRRLTYHVGEDFIHIASGLRAMMETVRFLNFDAGCRIGHGTAAGLDIATWWRTVGTHVVMPLEDRLDDLLFARDIILCCCDEMSKLPLIDIEIQRLAQYIWQDPKVTPDDLMRAWMLRGLDPLSQESALNDVEPSRRSEARRFQDAKKLDPIAHELFLRRHGIAAQSDQLRRCQEDIVISQNNDVLDENVLRTLQNGVLSELRHRQIAIETLPSSNVRISIHDTYESHHVQNWLHPNLATKRKPVSIAIGTDDPGIFATSLRMEYAHLLKPLQAMSERVQDGELPELVLEKICLDAKRFRF